MSEALDKMVAAMMADFEYQAFGGTVREGTIIDTGYEGVRIDVAQMARAGLKALADLPAAGFEPIFAAADAIEYHGVQFEAGQMAFDMVLAAILGENP